MMQKVVIPKDTQTVEHKLTRWQLVVLLVSIFIFGSAFGYVSGLNNEEKSSYIPQKEQFASYEIKEPKTVRMKLPAVSVANNSGVSAFLDVTAKQGNGQIFANLNNVLVSPETQHSARMAARVASTLTKTSISNVDLIYSMKADATILEGPSAGAAFTIATMAALQNRSLRNDVMITGTINHDGTIGPAGKVFEKALAAKKAGAILFLVPIGTSTDINYTEEEYCSKWNGQEFCSTELKPEIRNIAKETGIEVLEVKTIETAAKFFIT